MRFRVSQFQRQVLAYRPAEAGYYFLVGHDRRLREVRLPVRGAFRIEPQFQHPVANTGFYRVHYCRDQAAQNELPVMASMPELYLREADTAQERCNQVFAVFKQNVLASAPAGARFYQLVHSSDSTRCYPKQGMLRLRAPFQFPSEVAVGRWYVRYSRDHYTALAELRKHIEATGTVDIIEPVGIAESNPASGPQWPAWAEKEIADRRAVLDVQVDLLTHLRNVPGELEAYRNELARLQSKLKTPGDHTPVFLEAIGTLREMFAATQQLEQRSHANAASAYTSKATSTVPPTPISPSMRSNSHPSAHPSGACTTQSAQSAPASILTLEKLGEQLTEIELRLLLMEKIPPLAHATLGRR